MDRNHLERAAHISFRLKEINVMIKDIEKEGIKKFSFGTKVFSITNYEFSEDTNNYLIGEFKSICLKLLKKEKEELLNEVDNL